MNAGDPYGIEALKKAEKDRNHKAALSYCWLLSFWVMLTNNGDVFVAMHAKQGVTITLFTLPLFLPNAGLLLLPFLGSAAAFLYGLGIYGALHGKELKIPGIWDLAQKIFRSKYIE